MALKETGISTVESTMFLTASLHDSVLDTQQWSQMFYTKWSNPANTTDFFIIFLLFSNHNTYLHFLQFLCAPVRWQWLPKQSDRFSLSMSLTWFHLCKTSMPLNLETAQVCLSNMTELSLLFTPAQLCIWANCSPDVSLHSHLITLHCDVCVGVQVNLKWARISSKIKNILIGWQPLLAVWFQSEYAISNGPGPPTDECSMKSCLKDTPQRNIHTHTQLHSLLATESKLITVSDGQVDTESVWSDSLVQFSSADFFWLLCIFFCLVLFLLFG